MIIIILIALHKKWSFPVRISSINEPNKSKFEFKYKIWKSSSYIHISHLESNFCFTGMFFFELCYLRSYKMKNILKSILLKQNFIPRTKYERKGLTSSKALVFVIVLVLFMFKFSEKSGFWAFSFVVCWKLNMFIDFYSI